MLAVMFLLNFISKLIEIKKSGERHPPVAEELYKEYARKSELDCMELRLRGEMRDITTRTEKTIAEIFSVQREMKTSTEKTFHEIGLMVGRIEGLIEGHLSEKKSQP